LGFLPDDDSSCPDPRRLSRTPTTTRFPERLTNSLIISPKINLSIKSILDIFMIKMDIFKIYYRHQIGHFRWRFL
jgi:hypothetical protein